MAARDVERALEEVKSAQRRGDYMRAIDAARSGAERTGDEELQIEEVVLLARIGSTDRAKLRNHEYCLDRSNTPRAVSLQARLVKDDAFATSGEPDRALLKQSLEIYLRAMRLAEEAGDREQQEYNGVNAVSLSHAIGEAAEVADLVEMLLRRPPSQSYWSWATRGELLIAKDAPVEEVVAAFETAKSQSDVDHDKRATTLAQLHRLAPDHGALDVLKPRPVLHYAGHMIAHPEAEYGRILARFESELKSRIERALDGIDPSAVFGSLASGSDILIVEAALARGSEVRVLLPFAERDFFAQSINPAGGDWARRARACLSHPNAQVTFLTKDRPPPGDVEGFAALSRYAMGKALLRARHIFGEAHQLIVWDGRPPVGAAGTAVDQERWRRTGAARTVVDVSDLGSMGPATKKPDAIDPDRIPAALVFGDVKSFSKLNETQLPVFLTHVMGAVAKALEQTKADRGAHSLIFRNTWGDGVFAVFKDASSAAHFAMELQDRMAALDLIAIGLPPDLKIRMGLHYGVVYRRTEPVTGAENFFGEAVARAARIEPVTTAGDVYASEEFASELELDPLAPAGTEYVGETEAAKKYGKFRLYRLTR